MKSEVNIRLRSALYLCCGWKVHGEAAHRSPAVALSFIRSGRQCDAGVGFPLCVCGTGLWGLECCVLCQHSTNARAAASLFLPAPRYLSISVPLATSCPSVLLTYLHFDSTSHKSSMLQLAESALMLFPGCITLCCRLIPGSLSLFFFDWIRRTSCQVATHRSNGASLQLWHHTRFTWAFDSCPNTTDSFALRGLQIKQTQYHQKKLFDNYYFNFSQIHSQLWQSSSQHEKNRWYIWNYTFEKVTDW